MSLVIGWLVTLLVGVLLLSFAAYLYSLRTLPLTGRPRTPTFDRFGQVVAQAENPDYRENPGEEHARQE